jgi:hypothetical protein
MAEPEHNFKFASGQASKVRARSPTAVSDTALIERRYRKGTDAVVHQPFVFIGLPAVASVLRSTTKDELA